MPRARNPARDKAFEIYADNGGDIDLIDISNELGIPAGTVRGWKNKDHWAEKINGTYQETERNVAKKRGAPKGSRNHETHGIYRRRLWRAMAQEDLAALQDMPTDEESLLLEQLRLLTWQEMDCLQSISKYRETSGDLAVHDIKKRVGKDNDETTTRVVNKIGTLSQLRQELTSIQKAKTRCIEALHRLRKEKQMEKNHQECGVTIVVSPASSKPEDE